MVLAEKHNNANHSGQKIHNLYGLINKLVNSYNGMLALSNEAIDNEMYIVFELEV